MKNDEMSVIIHIKYGFLIRRELVSTKNNKNKNRLGENLGYDFVKITGLPAAYLITRPRVIRVGEQPLPKGGYMLSANHCSFWDPIVILIAFWRRRVYSLITKDLYKNRLMTFMLDHIHCIQVDKDNFSINSFHEVTKQLGRGKVVLIFPEGQVNLDAKDMTAFKSGIILMAHRAKVPIVPMYLVPTDRWYHKHTVLIGDAIDIRSMCGFMPTMDELDKIGQYIRQKQEELKNHYYTNVCPGAADDKKES